MSILYKNGKHGAEEMLDSYEITPKELLDLLQKQWDIAERWLENSEWD